MNITLLLILSFIGFSYILIALLKKTEIQNFKMFLDGSFHLLISLVLIGVGGLISTFGFEHSNERRLLNYIFLWNTISNSVAIIFLGTSLFKIVKSIISKNLYDESKRR